MSALLRGLLGLLTLTLFNSGLIAQVNNLAPAGTASSSSTGFGGTPELANDGNRDGVFANGSVFHAAGGTGAGEWWEVDLGAEFFIDRVFVFPRQDVQQNSLRDFKLEIFNSADALVWSGSFLPEVSAMDDPWGTSLMSGTQGRRVRLTLNSPNFSELPLFMTFAELEVWGSADPLPANLVSQANITSSVAGFGSSTANGVDGDLSANFFANSDTDGPVFHDEASAIQGFYRLDFPTDITIGEVQLYNRIVNNLLTTTTEYRVSVLDSAGNTIASLLVSAADRDYDHILDFNGISGRTVVVEESNPGQFLAFAEVRVMALAGSAEFYEFTSISVNEPSTGGLAMTATIKPNVDYSFERSRDLSNWIEITDDLNSITGEIELMFTPAAGLKREFYRLRQLPDQN